MATVTATTVEDVAAVMRRAAADGLAVVVQGAGTKQHWGGTPHRCDLTVDLHGLDRVIDHAAGDMVVQVQAGVTLTGLAEAVVGAGQQLALDVPSYDDGTVLGAGTVGGALATGLAGPRQLRYGKLRDLVLGVTMVRADGTVASSGGRVVKNVAGYDLGKLLCGSYGTLGVIVEATLRLHPLPAATGWVTVTAPGAAEAYGAVKALADSQLAPSAVELDRPEAGGPVTVAVLLEGTGDGVAARAGAAAALAGGVVAEQPPEWFGRWPGGPDGTLVEVSFPPASMLEVLGAVDAAARRAGTTAAVRGSPAVASLQVGLPEAEPLAGFLSSLRDGLAPYRAYAVVRHTPEPARGTVDLWGPVHPGALGLMRRVSKQFDPDHRLAPGVFVGGI